MHITVCEIIQTIHFVQSIRTDDKLNLRNALDCCLPVVSNNNYFWSASQVQAPRCTSKSHCIPYISVPKDCYCIFKELQCSRKQNGEVRDGITAFLKFALVGSLSSFAAWILLHLFVVFALGRALSGRLVWALVSCYRVAGRGFSFFGFSFGFFFISARLPWGKLSSFLSGGYLLLFLDVCCFTC